MKKPKEIKAREESDLKPPLSVGRRPHPRGCPCWRCQDERDEYRRPEYRRDAPEEEPEGEPEE